MARVFDVLFNTGQDEGADRIALPEGSFRLMQNARLTRDGRVEVRPQYVALNNDVYTAGGGEMRAFDLAIYDDKLIAFGAGSSISSTPGYAKDVYTYLGSGAPATWKGLFDDTISYPALPVVSDLEIAWQAPAGFYADSHDVAYTNGHACVCMCDVSATTGRAFVLRDGVLLQTKVFSSVRSMRVVAVGNSFVLMSRTTSDTVQASTFDTTSVSSWTAMADMNGLTGGAISGTTGWDACSIPGSTTDWLVAVPRPGSTRVEVRRYRITTFTSSTVWSNIDNNFVGDPGLATDGTNTILAVRNSSTNNVVLRTISNAGATTAGPTNVIGAGTGHDNPIGAPALSVVTTNRVCIQSQVGLTGQDSVYSVRDIDDHGLVASGVYEQTRVYSKLFNVERTTTLDEAFGLGTVRTGTIGGVGALYGTTIQGTVLGYLLEARFNYNVADFMAQTIVTNYHGRPSVAEDGEGNFWGVASISDESGLGISNTQPGTPQLVKFKAGSPARKQTAEMQGALYIAGGFVGYYDGVWLVESGFLDIPQISSVVQGTTGSLTQLATYKYCAIWEWTDALGRVHRSEPSLITDVALTGSNDSVTLELRSAHSVRNIDLQGAGSLVQSVVYRIVPDDSVFYRVGQVAQLTGEAGYCDPVDFEDTTADADLEIRPVAYFQAQKPTVNVALPSCRFISAGRDRLILGGLPDPYLVVFSQLPFPGEPIEGADYSTELAYQARLPERVTAVSGFGDTYLAFTASAVYEIPGAGPQRNGTGEFFAPRAIYSDGGCIDWRSVVDTANGIFFQLASNKIYRVTPAGAVEFVGERVQDTLTSFPVVRAAALCTESQRVVFAVVDDDDDPTDGGLLVYDLIHDAWSFDTIGVTASLVEYEGRIAYVQDGLVYLEEASAGVGSGALPTLSLRTGSFRLFPASGQGTVCKIVLQGTYLGDSTLEAFISYDDGKTWTSMGTDALTAANKVNPVSGSAVVSGDPITSVFCPRRREVDRFALRFDLTNGSNTGGTRLLMLSLEVEANEFITRQPARNQR
jgi:hypothetical protein